MNTPTHQAAEKGEVCPTCGDTMTSKHSNTAPTWSDQHDNIVCWWCAHHTEARA